MGNFISGLLGHETSSRPLIYLGELEIECCNSNDSDSDSSDSSIKNKEKQCQNDIN